MSDGFNWNHVLGDDKEQEQFPTDGSSALKLNPLQSEANEILKTFDEQDDKLGHYRPIHVNQDVHAIELDNGRFNHEDLADLPKQLEADAQPIANAHIDDILRMAIERKASDIHLTVGLPPMMRLDGELAPLPYTILNAQDTRRLIYDTFTDEQLQKFEQTHELDFAYSVKGLARFRFNAYIQRGSVTGALRGIPTKIPSFEQLGLPGVVRELSQRCSGLILVTGPTGSGKSTTIASMIDDINDNRTSHILPIADR